MAVSVFSYAEEPGLYIYDCTDNGLGSCNSGGTPPFDNCASWGTYKIPTLNPVNGPYTIVEVNYDGPFSDHGKQCQVKNGGGALATRSIAYASCQNTAYSVTGSDVHNQYCHPSSSSTPQPARQLGPSCPNCGDPINPAPIVGNKYEIKADYIGTGPFPLRLERYYNSAGTVLFPGKNREAFAFANWRHSYEQRITLMVLGSLSFAKVDRADGNTLYYSLSGSAWVPENPDMSGHLEQATESSILVWKFTNLNDEVERYEVASGNLLSITNRAGLVQTIAHDSLNRVTTVTDPVGHTLTFSYGGTACSFGLCVVSVQDPAGNSIQYGYDNTSISGNNYARLITVTYPGTGTPLTYNYSGKTLTEIVDENGNSTVTWTYDSNARGLTSQRAGSADKVTVTYPSSTTTQVTYAISISPAVNRVSTYTFATYQGIQRLTGITGDVCPACGAKASQYDTNGYLSQSKDWNDNITTYLRQDSTRPELETSRTEGLNSSGVVISGVTRTIETTWNSSFRLPATLTEKNSAGTVLRTTSLSYDSYGNLTGKTVTIGTAGATRTWGYTYNSNGQVLTVDGPRNNSTDVVDVTTYTYNSNSSSCSGMTSSTGCRGQLASISNALSQVTTIDDYNANGQPLSITDPNGLVTTLAYDTRMRLTSRTVGSEVTTYTYDYAGQLTRVTLPDSTYLNYTYDNAHRLTRIADNGNNHINYTLDAMGNRTAVDVYYNDTTNDSSHKVSTHSQVFNSLNQLYQDVGAASQTTQYAYDSQGNLTSSNGPLSGSGDTTGYSYDALNRLIQVTDANSGTVGYTLNALNQLTDVTDPRGKTTSYTIDALDNVNSTVSPDAGTTTNTSIDPAGNVLVSKDGIGQSSGRTTTYTYDALNRVATVAYSADSSLNATFIYDATASGNKGKGRLTSVSDNAGTTAYVYDVHGRLTSEARTINSVTYTTGYHYDSYGRLDQVTYPDSRVINYSFDSVGRISQIATTKSSVTQTLVSSVTYQPFGPVKSYTYGNSQTYTRAYDQDGRIASFNLGGSTLYACFDAASRLIQFRPSSGSCGSSGFTYEYGYDVLDRLTGFTSASASQSFTYDATGNRASATISASTDTYNINSANNRISSISGAHSRTYTYDNDGSVTADGVNTYSFDARNRMSQSVSSLTTTYTVDSQGQRTRKSSSNGDTVYIYDAMGHLIEEATSSGTRIKSYVYLGDLPVAVIQ